MKTTNSKSKVFSFQADILSCFWTFIDIKIQASVIALCFHVCVLLYILILSCTNSTRVTYYQLRILLDIWENRSSFAVIFAHTVWNAYISIAELYKGMKKTNKKKYYCEPGNRLLWWWWRLIFYLYTIQQYCPFRFIFIFSKSLQFACIKTTLKLLPFWSGAV